MRNRVGLAVGACLLAGSGVAGAEKADVAALAWLAGSWLGTAGGVEMEELWLPPKGGAMVGLHRDVAGGRMVSFEFLRIESDADGLVYLAANEEWAWRRVQ